MILQFFKTIYVLLYIAIAAQGIFYWMGIADALEHISLGAFMEQRKAIDAVIANPLRIIYLSTLITGITLIWMLCKQPFSIMFILVVCSLLFLCVDGYFIFTKSLPLNRMIDLYEIDSHIILFESVRKEWLFYIKLRGFFAISGLLIMLTGILWQNDISCFRKI